MSYVLDWRRRVSSDRLADVVKLSGQLDERRYRGPTVDESPTYTGGGGGRRPPASQTDLAGDSVRATPGRGVGLADQDGAAVRSPARARLRLDGELGVEPDDEGSGSVRFGHCRSSELFVGCVDPWVGLSRVEIFQFLVGRVGLGPIQQKY